MLIHKQYMLDFIMFQLRADKISPSINLEPNPGESIQLFEIDQLGGIRSDHVYGDLGVTSMLKHYCHWPDLYMMASSLLALCVGNSPVPGEFPSQRPVTWRFDVFFDLCQIKGLSKQSWGWWFELPSCPLWCHCNDQTGNYGYGLERDSEFHILFKFDWKFLSNITKPSLVYFYC